MQALAVIALILAYGGLFVLGARALAWWTVLPRHSAFFGEREGSPAAHLFGLLLLVELVPLGFVSGGTPWGIVAIPVAVGGLVLLDRSRSRERRLAERLLRSGELEEWTVVGKSRPELGPGHPNPRFALHLRDDSGAVTERLFPPPIYHAHEVGDRLRAMRPARSLRGGRDERVLRPTADDPRNPVPALADTSGEPSPAPRLRAPGGGSERSFRREPRFHTPHLLSGSLFPPPRTC